MSNPEPVNFPGCIMVATHIEYLAQSILDALPAHAAIIDGSGWIVAINRAWRDYAVQHNDSDLLIEGGNYLQRCDQETGTYIEVARQLGRGVRAVLAGERETFEFEYPFFTPVMDEWYNVRIHQLQLDDQPHALITRENITERVLSAQMTRQLNAELESTVRDLFSVYDIGRALASTLDLEKIYRILYTEVIRRLPGTRSVRIDLYDDETRTLRCGFVATPAGEGDPKAFPPYKVLLETSDSALSETVRTRFMRFQTLANGEVALYVPLIAGDHVMGIMTLASDQPDSLSIADPYMIESIASQAAFAIQNARLYSTIHSHAAELNALYNATSVLFQAENLAQLGQQIVKIITLEFAQADCGLIMVDRARNQVMRLARTGEYQVQAHTPIYLDQPSLVTEAIRRAEIVYASDVSQNPLYQPNQAETRSELVIPLRTSNGVVGVLDLQSQFIDAFSQREQRVLVAFAERVAHFVENMQLQEELRRSHDELEGRVAERTAQLARAKSHAETILNSSPTAITLVKPGGLITQTNPAFSRHFGYVDDEVFRLPISVITCDEPEEVLNSALTAAVTSGFPQRLEVTCCRKDNSRFVADLMIAHVTGTEDVICSFRDITERIEMEENLRQALEKERELNELKSRFVSMVSHEFRTPLATIQSSTDLLKHYAERMTVERRDEHLNRVQNQVMRLTDMMEDILTVSRAETVGLELRPTPVAFDNFCLGLAEEMQQLAIRHEVIYRSQGAGATLNIDPKLMRQAIINLLQNAVKYSPSDTQVHLDVVFDVAEVRVSVTDQGIGIPEDDLRHLFQPFHRATNVGNKPGTGIGLVIVKQVVELHGGTLDVSTQLDVGTTFTIHLPIQL